MTVRSETELYAPVKAFLERQGYAVKGEVQGCDVVALRADEDGPVIVELKRRFTLGLVLQGIDRLALSDRVYLAVPAAPRRRRGAAPAPEDADVRRLCRLIGLGLMIVHPRRSPAHRVEVLLDPGPYRPRKSKARLAALLGEHARRVGDPNRGGSTRVPIVTAYRQEALRCVRLLQENGPMRLAALRATGRVPNAARILQRDVYGWFARVARGTYHLSDAGRAALDRFAAAIAADEAHDGTGAAAPAESAPLHRESGPVRAPVVRLSVEG